MLKKLTLLAMAVAAFAALVAPAMASAADTTTLTEPAKTKVAVGQTIVGTSTNSVANIAGIGKLICPTVTLTGKITENTGTTVAGTGSGTTTGTCFKELEGVKEDISISNITLTELMSTGTVVAGQGTADVAFSFVAEIPTGSGVKCTFKTPTTVTGDDATYSNGGDTLTLTAQALNSACGNGTFSGTFTITHNGNPVVIDVE